MLTLQFNIIYYLKTFKKFEFKFKKELKLNFKSNFEKLVLKNFIFSTDGTRATAAK